MLRWLTGLARTAGLSRADSVARTSELVRRLGLEPAATRPLHVLSRGNTQRVLVAQALVGEPGLVILDEPSGGLDADGVARVAAEIVRAAHRGGVVLVARHPTAPLPLPAGTTWRFHDGTVHSLPRGGGVQATAASMEVETGNGMIRRVTEAELPGVLRAALDAGVPVRRVEPILDTAAGPPLQAAAVTAIALIPVMSWLTVLAHRVDGRELARAFAAHVGGRARAHLATDLCLAPFAGALVVLAVVWPVAGQGSQHHPSDLVLRMFELHVGAALFGIGLGSVLALIERTGWRVIVAIAVFLGLIIVRDSPLTPLLRLSTAPVNDLTPVASQVFWLAAPGVILVAAGSYLATRVL